MSNAFNRELLDAVLRRSQTNGYVNQAFDPEHTLPSSSTSGDNFRFSMSDDFRTILSQMEIGAHENRKWMEANGVQISTNGKKLGTTLIDIELVDTVSLDQSTSDDIALTTCQPLSKVDFRSELRSMSDTSRYMKELVVLLNVQQCTLAEVVDKLLQEVSNSSHSFVINRIKVI